MAQTPQIIYGLVARKTTVLAEHFYQETGGNYHLIARRILETISDSSKPHSYMMDDYAFHYQVFDGLTFLCMAHLELDRMKCFHFIRKAHSSFQESFATRNWRSAIAFQFQPDFEPVLKRLCDEINSTQSKFDAINEQLADVKEILSQNIEEILNRGENLEVLVDKAEELNATAYVFRNQATDLHRHMWWENTKCKLFLILVVLAIVYGIICVVCDYKFECHFSN